MARGQDRDLELAVRQLQTANSVNHATINGGTGLIVEGIGGITLRGGGGLSVDDDGNIVVRDGGNVTLLDDAGRVVARLGRDTTGPGVVTFRPDGTSGLEARSDFTAIRDKAQNIVVSDDATSGAGLASPWLSLDRPADTNTATWPGTAATAWTAIASSYVQRQNPGITWSFWCQADPATTGQFRVLIDGAVIATSPTVTAAFSVWTATYYWPAGWAFNSTAAFEIDAHVTAGTGAVRCQTLQLRGAQSP